MLEIPSFDITQEIPVMEHFFTIQGEGFYSGRAAYFVRLAGCDVGCVWCDVKESWKVDRNQVMSYESLITAIKASKTNFVVITGGEPAIYDLTNLTNLLHAINVEVAIETSGSSPIKGAIDWVCLSPKKFKAPTKESYTKAHELKIIAYNKHDFEWALSEAHKVDKKCLLMIQPEWDKQEIMLPLVIEFVKNNPRWKVSLQTHKYMNIP